MSGLALSAAFLLTSWLLYRGVDLCYRGRVPSDARGLDDLPAAPEEPRARGRTADRTSRPGEVPSP
jgi:hypothetical protein